MTGHDAPRRHNFLTSDDYATKLTAAGSVPTDDSRPDEFAIWRLSTRWLLVDTEAGEVYRTDGTTRAEYVNKQTGYGKVMLGRPWGRQRWAQAHRIVWIARYGPIPGQLQVNHLNGRRWDNRIGNLELVTAGDNVRHAFRQPYEHVVGVDINGPDDRPTISPYATAATRIYGLRRRTANYDRIP